MRGRAPSTSLHSGSLLTRPSALSVGLHDLPAAGFLTSPLLATHSWTNGAFVPSFVKILEPWVRLWVVPKEEWTRCRLLCQEASE